MITIQSKGKDCFTFGEKKKTKQKILKWMVTAYNRGIINQSNACRWSRCLTAQAGELGHKLCLRSGQEKVNQRWQAACLCLLRWIMTVVKQLESHLIRWMGWNSPINHSQKSCRRARVSLELGRKQVLYSGSNERLPPPPNSNKVAFVHFMDFYYSKIHKKRYTLKESKSHGLLSISTEIFVQY